MFADYQPRTASNQQIQEAFLDVFLSLLADFNDYLLFTRVIPEPAVCFEKHRYEKNKSSVRPVSPYT